MNKLVFLLVVLFVIAGIPAIPLNTHAANLNDNLVAHWDFNGADLTEQLADKAPSGSSADNLTLEGNVVIQNGVAKVPKAGGSYLYAKNQSDLNSFTQFTTILKFRANGVATGFADFISKDSTYWYRAFINNSKSSATSYAIDCRLKGSASLPWNMPGNGTFAPETDLYFALTAVLDTAGQKVTLLSYMSTDGVNYSQSAVKTLTLTDPVLGTQTNYESNPLLGALVIGKNVGNNRNVDMGINYVFDDIRIYNKALSLSEIQSVYATNIPESSNAFKFFGFSIRTEEPQGLRAKFQLSEALLTAETAKDGYELLEYGVILTQRASYDQSEGAAGAELKLGIDLDSRPDTGKITIWQNDTYHGSIYQRTEEGYLYTGVLIGIKDENLNKDYAFRAYCVIALSSGETRVLYSDTEERSIYDLAKTILADPDNGLSEAELIHIQTTIVDVVESGS